MKALEIMKFQEYLSRQVQGIYAGLTISLEWLKLQPTDIKYFLFLSIFLKKIWALTNFCFLFKHKYQADQIDADVPGFPESPLLIYYT